MAETGANDPLPYSTLPAAPSILIPAMLPAPPTFASATEFATAANGTSPETLAPATAFAVPANVAKFIVPEIFAATTLDMPPPSPVIKPVVVIVFDPNAF